MFKIPSVFRSKNFSLLWVGLLISATGSQMQSMAINWQIYDITKSAYSLGLVGLSIVLPLIVVSPLAGYAADSFDRRKVALVSQIGLTFIALIFAVVSSLNPVTPVPIFILIIF